MSVRRAAALVSAWAVAVSAETGALNIPSMVIGKDVHGVAVSMPMSGLGTWLYNNSQAEQAVSEALKAGVRLIDTANGYENQVGVARAIQKSGVKRSELFILTKIPGGLGEEGSIAAHRQNLQQLRMSTVDLLLTHFPCGWPADPSAPPVNCSKAARQATWRGLETMYKQGLARAIGVSHYCQQHMEDIFEIATVPIAVNQQEWHVGMGPDPEGVVSFCKAKNIVYQSFSPLCGPCEDADRAALLSGNLTTGIANNHKVSAAQVALRWLVEQGSPVIPKSLSPAHIRENMDLFSFQLTAEEKAKLDAATVPASAEPVSDDCKLTLAADSEIVV